MQREGPALGGGDAWMGQLYRGLTQRSVMWRQRLDVTVNWAAPILIAIVTFGLGDRGVPHLLLLVLGLTVIAVALVVEARRYCLLQHALWRVYLVEVGYFGSLLSGIAVARDWSDALARDLRAPRPVVNMSVAARARLRSTYLVFVYLLAIAWLAKVVIHPRVARSLGDIVVRMGAGPAAGWGIAIAVATLVAAATAVAATAPSTGRLEHGEAFARWRGKKD